MIGYILTLAFLVINCNAVVQPHLGCYNENKDDRDLPEEVWTNNTDSSSLNITECIVTCQMRGFPYAGLGRGAQECFCGSNYGNHGKSEDCLYVCLNFPGYSCGGSNEYNIYYTVQQEKSCPTNTRLVERLPYDVCLAPIATDSKTFNEARIHCLQQNKEIVSIDTKETVDVIESLMTNASKGNANLWIGLSRSLSSDEFQWTSKHETFSKSALTALWESGHPKSDLCVFYNSQTQKFETGSCSTSHWLMCQSTLDKTSIVIYKTLGEKIADFFADDGNLALVIVVTLIAMVIVGCVVLYCFQKKAKSNRKQRMLIGRPNTFGKGKVFPSDISNKSN